VFKYQNYILFPIYDDGKVKGYLGRYASKRVPANKLRYNNSIDTDFASLLYGYDEIIKDKTETVIIVEGVFDKISVDKKLGLINNDEVKCVCTFGKKISDVQIRKLIAKNVSNIVLSWDFDALREIKQYGIELDHYFNTSVAVCTFKKDIDECTQNEVIKVFSDIKPISNFNLDVIGKLKR
jgi:DNA primase